MKPKHLLLQFAAFAVLFGLFNAAIPRLERRTPAAQVVAAIRNSLPATDIFLGNSLMASGLDVQTFSRALPERTPLNLALGGSQPVEHEMLFEAGVTGNTKVVCYGFYDFQLSDLGPAEWRDIWGNRSVDYMLGIGRASELLAPNDAVKALGFRASGFLPVVVYRGEFWGKTERLRRQLGELGVPKEATNRFGRVGDFSLLEATNGDAFGRACTERVEQGAPFNVAIQRLVDECRHRNIRLIFVKMPMPSAHRKVFYGRPEWPAYEGAIRARIKMDGAEFVDASEWVSDEDFVDNLHVSPGGAKVFTAKLVEHL